MAMNSFELSNSYDSFSIIFKKIGDFYKNKSLQKAKEIGSEKLLKPVNFLQSLFTFGLHKGSSKEKEDNFSDFIVRERRLRPFYEKD
jgi:hypothetical protein